MKLKFYFISSFSLNLFEYIDGYVYIIYLWMSKERPLAQSVRAPV